MNTVTTTPAASAPESDENLTATAFFDVESPLIRDFVARVTSGATSKREKAIRLFYAVRDEILYDPYSMRLEPSAYRASHCLSEGRAYCVVKASLMTAAARAAGIPARLGLADVRNHLCTERLRALMGGLDIFYFHGYTALWLEQRWLKVTPVFNLALCDKFGVLPQEFDGSADSLFQPFDRDQRLHMEYIHDHGTFADLPFDLIVAEMRRRYPAIAQQTAAPIRGDFAAEAATERAD